MSFSVYAYKWTILKDREALPRMGNYLSVKDVAEKG